MTKLNSDILALLAKVEKFTTTRTDICTAARMDSASAEMWLRRARRAIKTGRKLECLANARDYYLAARAAL